MSKDTQFGPLNGAKCFEIFWNAAYTSQLFDELGIA
jgi:hypothetical protein